MTGQHFPLNSMNTFDIGHIAAFLRNFGLNESEIKVYLYLVTHGESIVSIISKRLEMKRATCYQTLEGLEKKEFVTTFMKNNVTHFDAIEPDDIVALCEQRVSHMQILRRKAESLNAEFERLRRAGSMPTLEVKGKVKYYEGLDAVTDLIDETLNEKCKEQLCFGLNTYHSELAGDDWGRYTQKRVRKGMKVKSIQPDTQSAVEYKSRDKQELRETKLVPHDTFPGQCEINVIGDLIALISTSGAQPMGMKLRSKELAQGLSSLFKLAWERSEEYDKKISK